MRDSPFEEVLRKAVAGDVNARRELFERIAREDEEGGALLAIARKLLPAGDRARDFVESRDLVQTALKSGWLDLSGFRGQTPAEFLAWLRTILRNKLGRVTRRRTPRVADDGSVPQEEISEEAAPVAQVLRQELRDRVRAAVHKLPEDQRLVLELRLRGLSSRQIADEIGLSADAVRQRESRASKRLRELLSGSSAGGES